MVEITKPEIIKKCQISAECKSDSSIAIKETSQLYNYIYGCKKCAIQLRDALLKEFPIAETAKTKGKGL